MGCSSSIHASQPHWNYNSMEKVVDTLENILQTRYGYSGTLKDTIFSSRTEEAFQQLIDVLERSNKYVEIPAITTTDNTPRVGDLALVYWYGYGWFTAKIESWLPDELSYMVRWTDGNWAPEKAKYTDLCIDKIPDPTTIGVGTKVLFKQGLYYAGYNDDGSVCDSTGRTLSAEKKKELNEKGQVSDRWHMGTITEAIKKNYDETVYNGEHIKADDSQCTRGSFVDYSPVFKGLKLDELRTLPNIFNCLDSSDDSHEEGITCDVFLSKVVEDNSYVNPILQDITSKCNVSASKGDDSSKSLQQTVGYIKSCKVYLVCISDNFIVNQQAMSELLYAKKTLGKPVIPLIIGVSRKWSETTAGMILAGQLYIQFGSADVYNEKLGELETNLKKLMVTDSSDKKIQSEETIPSGDQPNVFLSYCWSNSQASYEAGQVNTYTGHLYSDPRKIKCDIEDRIGEKVWLDIEQLDSVDDSGMFGQISQGLAACSTVVLCISKEYANSQNCQMEANFALRSLRKNAIVLEVGSGCKEDRKAWLRSSIGIVLPTDEKPFIMTPDTINNSHMYESMIEQICRKLTHANLANVSIYNDESTLRASVPMIGDSVIAFYAAWQFFPAKVASFDIETMKYTVDWDDPDPSCRVQPYNLVAVNRTPNENEIGVGTTVLFKQGIYRFGSSTGDVWNLGEITNIATIDNEFIYSGKHSKTAEDGLAVASWPSYKPTFEGARCHDLRLFPNAIEMCEAYKNLWKTTET